MQYGVKQGENNNSNNYLSMIENTEILLQSNSIILFSGDVVNALVDMFHFTHTSYLKGRLQCGINDQNMQGKCYI